MFNIIAVFHFKTTEKTKICEIPDVWKKTHESMCLTHKYYPCKCWPPQHEL